MAWKMNWYDRSSLPYGLLWNDGDALNGILHLGYVTMLKRMHGEGTTAEHEIALAYIAKVNDHGNISSGIEKTVDQDRASHDDMTGIVCQVTKEEIGKINTIPYLYRPAEFVLYNLWNGNKFAKLLIPIFSLATIVSCCRVYKADNGIEETDGKMLAWLTLETFDFKVTKKICYWFLRRQYGEQWLKALLLIRYNEPENPVRMAARV